MIIDVDADCFGCWLLDATGVVDGRKWFCRAETVAPALVVVVVVVAAAFVVVVVAVPGKH